MGDLHVYGGLLYGVYWNKNVITCDYSKVVYKLQSCSVTPDSSHVCNQPVIASQGFSTSELLLRCWKTLAGNHWLVCLWSFFTFLAALRWTISDASLCLHRCGSKTVALYSTTDHTRLKYAISLSFNGTFFGLCRRNPRVLFVSVVMVETWADRCMGLAVSVCTRRLVCLSSVAYVHDIMFVFHRLLMYTTTWN